MKKTTTLLLFVLFFLSGSGTLAFYKGWENGPWELSDEDDGLKIYVNDSAHPDVPAVRVDTVIAAPPSKVFEVVIEHDRARNQEDVTAYEVLEQSRDGFTTYQRVDPPAIDERDFVLRGTFVRAKGKGGSYAFRWKAAADGPEPKDGVVRVDTVEGVFALEPTADGDKTRVSYRSLFDPRVSAPSFFIKRALVSDATDRVEDLRAVFD